MCDCTTCSKTKTNTRTWGNSCSKMKDEKLGYIYVNTEDMWSVKYRYSIVLCSFPGVVSVVITCENGLNGIKWNTKGKLIRSWSRRRWSSKGQLSGREMCIRDRLTEAAHLLFCSTNLSFKYYRFPQVHNLKCSIVRLSAVSIVQVSHTR